MATKRISLPPSPQSGSPATKPSWIRANFTSDLAMAGAVIGIVLILFLPLHHFILDFMIAVSIAISLLVLLVSLYIQKPLDFASFPTVLLVVTLFRLALNVATTRNILTSGGSGDVSALISAFGSIVLSGNYAVGIVIFAILMVINFIVITKGAGRVAEVSARFTLDAMPGKQMAIDAELNSGHINADEARRRRSMVEKEADFYGAMDGASKFVRGDAIAAIIIFLVNGIFGIIIGVMQRNMPIAEAAKLFTLLSVGDGLIASIPALMISTAAGIIVTRSTSEGDLSEAVVKQFRVHPKAFFIASGLSFFFGVIPLFPLVPFALLSAGLGALGFFAEQKIKADRDAEILAKQKAESQQESKSSDSIENLMRIDMLTIEVGLSLVPLIDPSQDGEVVDRIQSIRKQFAQDLGIIVPQIQLRDNLQLEPGQYVILLKGNKVASGHLMIDYFMAMDPGNVSLPIQGDPTSDPVYGLPAIWVTRREKDEASFRGYTVVNCATVMATHITKVLKENCAELLTRQDVQFLIDKLKETNPKVVDEVIQAERLSVGDVVKVMQNLLREEVSIRDILSLFECMADHCKIVKSTEVLSEYCRRTQSRAIISKYLSAEESLCFVTFDRMLEDVLMGGLVTTDNGSSYLNLEARSAQEILEKLMAGLKSFEKEGTQPILLISARIRQAFYKLVNRYLPQLVVLSYDEIPPGIQTKNLEMIR